MIFDSVISDYKEVILLSNDHAFVRRKLSVFLLEPPAILGCWSCQWEFNVLSTATHIGSQTHNGYIKRGFTPRKLDNLPILCPKRIVIH